MVRRVFAAMGTEVELLLDADAGPAAERALTSARAEFERLEAVCSRFRPDSELSLLNREGSRRCSPDLVRVVELALAAREQTDGLFDPTVHDAVTAAGYDRSFELISAPAPWAPAGARCGGDVQLESDEIRLAPGTRLDLGGIAKGYAVDRAAELLAIAGPCLVNAGGDLAVRGGAWPVGVLGELTLELSCGAIATSGVDRRRWTRGAEQRHHLIDPSTGLPARTPYLRVTVVAPGAVEAEVLAKAVFLGASVDVPRVLVLADGRVLLAGGLE